MKSFGALVVAFVLVRPVPARALSVKMPDLVGMWAVCSGEGTRHHRRH